MAELIALATAASVAISKIVEVIRRALGNFGDRLPGWTWAVVAMVIGAGVALVAQIDVNDIPAEADPSVLRGLIGSIAGALGSLVHRVDDLLHAKAESEDRK